MKFITVKNSRDFEIAVKYTNAAGEEIEAVLQPGGSVDVAEEQVEAVENQLKSAEAPKAEVDLAKMLNEALAPMQAKLEAIEKNAFDKAAEEPKFKKQENGAKTFSNEGNLVVDLTMGSGSTGVACKNTNRSFIGIEKDENYFKIAEQRINARTLFS